MEPIRVNQAEISPAAIAAEMQYHPATDRENAWQAAATALVVRQLLLQEAGRLGLSTDDETADPSEGKEETLIRQLLNREIVTPEPDEATCHRYWLANQAKFRSPDLYEAAHILFAAAADDKAARATARQAAMDTLQQVLAWPDSFAALAQQRSACPSGANGGLLGQQSRGDLVSEFETFIVALEEGQICPVPVQTRYGFHVLRLDRFCRGQVLPFETASPIIERQLRAQTWQRAVSQYLRILAGRAEISGIVVESVQSPLVQ
ncbi:MAG: peptidylprolyl isomerase [Rhodospirillaceae bacterium]|nr:MAG: peptidylprolyl isomerase [Rhodospirillaceae bacterium]